VGFRLFAEFRALVGGMSDFSASCAAAWASVWVYLYCIFVEEGEWNFEGFVSVFTISESDFDPSCFLMGVYTACFMASVESGCI
jgi:hypothetical protein